MTTPRRLSVYFSERADIAAGTDGEPAAGLGAIYLEPFSAPLSMWSFSARVAEALCEHTWRPTQDQHGLKIVLTPALAPGDARVASDVDHFREVLVGLVPERWNASSVADKRRVLVELTLRQLEAMRSTWSLDWERLQRAAKDMLDAYATLAAPVGDASPVVLGSDLAQRLDLAAWTAAAPADRLAVGRDVAARTRAFGHELGEPELDTLPSGQVVVRASAGDIRLVLVPGGRMRRGFDEKQLAGLDRVYRSVWYSDTDPTLGGGFPRSLTPFGADLPCRVDGADHVDISPMWMAEATCDVEDEPVPWNPEVRRGLTTWRRTLEFLAQRRLTLPTSDELLWGASAGDARLFPWGDDPSPIRALLEGDAAALAESYGLVNDQQTPYRGDPFETFAGRNHFGLAATLSHGTWCMPVPDPYDPAPFVQVGGALDGYPWQGGWEAMLFLTRVVTRVGFDGRLGAPRAAVRPVVRLSR